MKFTFKHGLMLASAMALAACGEDVPLPDKTVQQLMADEVQPTAEAYWDSVRYVSDEEGFHEYLPESDEDWEQTRAAAVALGEYGELLKTPAYANGRGDDWIDFSQALVDISKRAEQAAVDQDVEAVFDVGGTVYNVCTACHQAYPPEELPEGVTEAELRPTVDVPLEEYSGQE